MKNKLFFAFKSRPFLILWLAEIFTQIPVNLLNFLLILIVFNLTKSNTAVSGIVLSFTLPAVLFGTLAGVYIDRWNKRTVLLVSNIIRAILLIILAIFHKEIMVVYIVSILITIITQFFIPAEIPIIPLLTKEEHLLSANALFGIGIFGSILVAYLFSGPLLLYFGIVPTLLLLAGMLFVAAFLITLIRIPKSEVKKGFSLGHLGIPLHAVVNEIHDVMKLIRSSRHISSSLFLLALSQIIILIIAAIAPGYANEVLQISVEQFPLLVITPATVGIIVGAFIIANLFHGRKKESLVIAGILLSGIVMVVMPYGNALASRDFIKTINDVVPRIMYISHIDIIISLSFLLGIANAFVFVPSNTILQEKTSDEMRGKVYGVLNTLVGIFSFIPIIAVGSFSDMIGVGRVLIGIGCSLILIAILKIFV